MSRRAKWLAWIGGPAVVLIVVYLFWNWNWFIPLVEARASAAVGRTVTIGQLHVAPGRITRVTASDIAIANPPDWQGDPTGQIERLIVEVDAWQYIRHGELILPLIDLAKPRISIAESADGQGSNLPDFGESSEPGPSPRIGALRISEGVVRVVFPQLRADVTLQVGTRDTDSVGRDGESAGSRGELEVNATGTYGGAPVKGRMVGGSLLALMDNAQAWPVDLQAENGPTRISLVGTVQDPINMRGSALKLRLSGPDLARIERLVGFPIPQTPPYELTGDLDLSWKRVLFRDFAGRVGSSDLAGTFDINLAGSKPDVIADLRSKRVDLADLGGFIGSEPGRTTTPGQTAAQRAEVAKAEASPKFIPERQISIPKLMWANIHLKYRAQRIQGNDMPLDNLVADLDLVDGRITLHPVAFGVGSGQIKADISMTPQGETVRTKADVAFQRLDVSRLMVMTEVFKGAGTLSGTGNLDATGNSLSQMLGSGSGAVRLAMVGGDLSAILVNLSGLQFGNALLSALGLPNRTKVECFVSDAALQRGVVTLRALVLDTGEGVVDGTGAINLKNETLDLQLRTEAKKFSVGSLPGPINISGTLKDPTIRPGAETVVRSGLAAGLGVLLAPLAVLPTIQFGTADDERCERLLASAKQKPGGQRLPAAPGGKPSR